MKRLFKAAMRGIKMELAAGESGWTNLLDAVPWSTVGKTAKSGQMVSPETAMTLSAVWACISRTSELVSSLPLTIYEKRPDGSRVKADVELQDILTVSPNAGQTGVEFWDGMEAQKLMRGNAYAEKLFVGRRLVGLRPVFNVTPERGENGEWKYAVNDRGRKSYLPASKIFHLRGFGSGDGLGLSAVRYGVTSMGAALAADETASSVFANSMMPSGVLTSEQTLNETQRTQLQTMLADYVGSSKAGKTMVLEAGLTHQALQMNPEDAQLLETRRFNVEDVCRWFGTPPIIIGHSADGQTMWGSGVEAIMLSWLTLGINPLLRRNEARIKKDLIPHTGNTRLYAEYNREAMLQMDSAAKGEFLSKMGTSGTMTANERRDKLNLPRHDDPAANALLAQTALAPLETLGKGKI